MSEEFPIDTTDAIIQKDADQSCFIEMQDVSGEARLLALVNRVRESESLPRFGSLAAGSIVVHSIRSTVG